MLTVTVEVADEPDLIEAGVVADKVNVGVVARRGVAEASFDAVLAAVPLTDFT